MSRGVCCWSSLIAFVRLLLRIVVKMNRFLSRIIYDACYNRPLVLRTKKKRNYDIRMYANTGKNVL